jgi:hypothetical protein
MKRRLQWTGSLLRIWLLHALSQYQESILFLQVTDDSGYGNQHSINSLLWTAGMTVNLMHQVSPLGSNEIRKAVAERGMPF